MTLWKKDYTRPISVLCTGGNSQNWPTMTTAVHQMAQCWWWSFAKINKCYLGIESTSWPRDAWPHHCQKTNMATPRQPAFDGVCGSKGSQELGDKRCNTMMYNHDTSCRTRTKFEMSVYVWLCMHMQMCLVNLKMLTTYWNCIHTSKTCGPGFAPQIKLLTKSHQALFCSRLYHWFRPAILPAKIPGRFTGPNHFHELRAWNAKAMRIAMCLGQGTQYQLPISPVAWNWHPPPCRNRSRSAPLIICQPNVDDHCNG